MEFKTPIIMGVRLKEEDIRIYNNNLNLSFSITNIYLS